MDINILILLISGAITLVGGFFLIYNIYHMTVIDAKSRGLKHPKLFGILNISGNNGNGFLLLYLIMRNKYPIKNLSLRDKKEFDIYKKKSILALAFHIIGALVFIILFIYKFM